MTDVKIVATGLGFPEGPVVCADGSVVLTEIRNGRCSRVTPDRTASQDVKSAHPEPCVFSARPRHSSGSAGVPSATW